MRLAALKREEDGLQREKERLEVEKERHFRYMPQHSDCRDCMEAMLHAIAPKLR